jgi:hypothetical protein
VIEVISVIAVFAITCRLYQYYTGRSVFKKRPRWNQREEETLEAAQFASYRSRDVTHIDPTYEYESQPFALDQPVWSDRRDVA